MAPCACRRSDAVSGAQPVWISGGTGLIGGRLVAALREEGRAVRLVSRHPERVPEAAGVSALGWDGLRVDPASLAGAAAAVHLAGEPLFGVRSAARLARVERSRIESTRSLADALAELAPGERPDVLVCASAVGYYGDRGEEILEESAPPGSGFIPDLCKAWEAEASRAAERGVRVVSVRIGVVLAREGGALAMLAPLFRLGLGGPLAGGRPWLPWIHAGDLVALLRRALDDARLEGAVNGVSPKPVRNAEFTRALARTVRRPAFLPVPGFALRLALGPVARELLDSRRVTPARALAAGFSFAQPDIEEALRTELVAA
jgi:uncharacterized protein